MLAGSGPGEDTRIKTRVGSNRNILSGGWAVTGSSSGKHGMRRGNQLRCGCCSRVAYPLNDTSKSEARPTRTIPRMKPTSRNAKQITCWTRFRELLLFASSGMNKADSALCAIPKSLGSRVGAFTIAFPVSWVVRAASRTEPYFIRSAITGFTTSVSLSRNRVSPQEAFEGLELGEGKLSCPVLRGLGDRKVARLLGA